MSGHVRCTLFLKVPSCWQQANFPRRPMFDFYCFFCSPKKAKDIAQIQSRAAFLALDNCFKERKITEKDFPHGEYFFTSMYTLDFQGQNQLMVLKIKLELLQR